MNESDLVNNTFAENYFTDEITTMQPFIISIGVMGVMSLIGNSLLLILSKFASGGKSPSLVFLRSLVVSDVMIGAFGIFKALVLIDVKELLVDCFLPEALFVTASSASIFTLFGLSIDCCLRLYHPLKYMLHMDKKNIVSVMVFVWNFSFVSGFIPLAGWHVIDYTCLYVYYFDPVYLILLGVILTLITIGCIIVQVISKKIIRNIRQTRSILTCDSKEFQKYQYLIGTISIDLMTWLVCFLPYFFYVLFMFVVSSRPMAYKHLKLNVFILYFMPAFLFRSFINSIIHGYRTAQIHYVMRHLSRKVSKIIQGKRLSVRDDKVTQAVAIASSRTSRKSSNKRREMSKHTNNIDQSRQSQSDVSGKSSNFTTSTISVIITEECMAESTQL